MKIRLIASMRNIHSNLAVYSLKGYKWILKDEVEIAEYTINHLREDILVRYLQGRKPTWQLFPAISGTWNMYSHS